MYLWISQVNFKLLKIFPLIRFLNLAPLILFQRFSLKALSGKHIYPNPYTNNQIFTLLEIIFQCVLLSFFIIIDFIVFIQLVTADYLWPWDSISVNVLYPHIFIFFRMCWEVTFLSPIYITHTTPGTQGKSANISIFLWHQKTDKILLLIYYLKIFQFALTTWEKSGKSNIYYFGLLRWKISP